MQHLFIINPRAGKKNSTARLMDRIDALRRAEGLDCKTMLTSRPGHAEELARRAAESGRDVRIYACGGDGTLNEVINGAVGFENAVITHYPAGSGNDFVKLFDAPDAFRDLERLLDGVETRLDLICCQAGGQRRYAANVCSLGLDARIGTEIAAYRRLPVVGGSAAYLLSTVVNVFRGIHQPYTVDFGSRRIRGDQTLICVCNGSWYGGSFHPVPDARPDDGLLDVLMVKPVGLLRLATAIGRYKQGEYRSFPNLITHCRTDRLRVTCDADSVVNVDGEALTAREVSFSVVPHGLRFLMPAGVRLLSKERNQELIGVI